jgi:hypothetical protein
MAPKNTGEKASDVPVAMPSWGTAALRGQLVRINNEIRICGSAILVHQVFGLVDKVNTKSGGPKVETIPDVLRRAVGMSEQKLEPPMKTGRTETGTTSEEPVAHGSNR